MSTVHNIINTIDRTFVNYILKNPKELINFTLRRRSAFPNNILKRKKRDFYRIDVCILKHKHQNKVPCYVAGTA